MARGISGLMASAARGRSQARQQVSTINSGGWGGMYGARGFYGASDSGIDWNREAGVRWDNSILFSIYSFICSQLSGVPFLTVQMSKSGEPEPIPNHPITLLLERPNPWHPGADLETGMVFQELNKGNGYAYKHRSPAGKVIALELLPEGACYPFTVPGSGEWISEYRIASTGGYLRVPPSDVLHIRSQTPNPYYPQLGLAPIEAGLPELVADKKGTRHEASLLDNSAVSSALISPKQLAGKVSGEEVELEFNDVQADQLTNRIREQIGGDAKGSPFVFNVPMDVNKLAFDPAQLLLTEQHILSESRLCALYHLPPAILNLLAGLKYQNNRASAEAAADATWENCLIPLMRHRGRYLTWDLVKELGQPGESVMYDESKIPALKRALVNRIIAACGVAPMTPNEGRAQLGLTPVEGADKLVGVKAGAPKPAVDPEDDEADDERTRQVNGDDGKPIGRSGDRVQGAEPGDGDDD